MAERARLRLFRFDPGTALDGGLVGAFERMELAGEAQLLDALLVRRGEEDGALEALDLAVGSRDSTYTAALDFRLEPRRRQALTARTLADHPGGVPASVIHGIGEALPAGAALVAILHTEPGTTDALDEAAARAGARSVADETVAAATLAAVADRLGTAAGRAS